MFVDRNRAIKRQGRGGRPQMALHVLFRVGGWGDAGQQTNEWAGI
jgi:hypothetical protein